MERIYDRCPNCMKEIQPGENVCSSCGFDIQNYVEKPNCLRPFTILENKYMIGRVIGMGGFGITYIGWDMNLQTYIAIKEYFPESLANRDTSVDSTFTKVDPKASSVEMYNKGLKRYVEEAQNISRFYNLKGIVSVKDFFYANDTAYIVMEYINGVNLKEYLRSCGGRLDENTVLNLMKPVFESLYQIHNAGLIHRDISPDNIMVDANGEIKLIDFGSARGQAQESEKTYTVILKHGYAPSEQYYAKGNQGPWTDIYSLCATMYKMLTGAVPPNSVERMENDEYMSPSAMGIPVSPRTEAVLAKGLAVKVSDRYQNIGQLLADLYGTAPVNAVPGMPTASAPAYNSQPSASQQSMQLNMQPVYSGGTSQPTQDTKKKQNIIIIICVAAALVIAGIVAAVILSGKDKGDKKTTETTEGVSEDYKTTEPGGTDTEEPDTNNPTTETTSPTGGYKYEWPTELSDDWHDYQMNINGTIYQFPIPYTEWKTKGWSCNSLPTEIAGNSYEYCYFTNAGLECSALLYNYGLNVAEPSACFIIAVEIDGEWDNIPDGTVIELPNGIQYGVSTESDIKTAYGAPDYYYQGEDYTSIDYAGDTYDDGMDLELGADGILNAVRVANTKVPEGLDIGSTDISMDVPDINALYEAPTGPSQSRTDGIFTIDGAYYKLPVPVSEFLQNGWILDSKTDDYIAGESSTSTYLEKNGDKISVTLENFTKNAILPANAYITDIGAELDYCKLEFVGPGGLALGANDADVDTIYGDLGEDYYSKDETSYSSFVAMHATYDDDKERTIYMSAYSDPETRIIDDLSYSMYIYEEDLY